MNPIYYPYGHDYGNSGTTGIAYVNGAVQELTMPSALYEGSYEELKNKTMGGLYQLDILNKHSHAITFRNEEFFVGNLAIEQAPFVPIAALTSRGDITRYWSIRSLAHLLTTSGTLIRDREYGLIVVTGLPIKTYGEENIQLVQEALAGKHEFVLDGEKRIAHVTVRKVVMEGSGANIAHGLGGKSKLVVVDIGGRTTDGYAANGQTPIIDQCDSLDTGVETAVDHFIEAFEKKFSFHLTARDAALLQTCFIGNKRYSDVATVKNVEATSEQIDELLTKAFDGSGRKISAFLKRLWSSSLRRDVVASDVEYVLCVGGGAHYFATQMKDLFGNRLTIPLNPECANAAGYARLALHFLNRDMKERVS